MKCSISMIGLAVAGLLHLIASPCFSQDNFRISTSNATHGQNVITARIQDHQMDQSTSDSAKISGMQSPGMAMHGMDSQIPDKPGHTYQRPPGMPAQPIGNFGDESFADGQVLDLDGLLSIATQNNPTLRQAQAHITAETGKAIQAGLYPNPTIRYAAEQIGVGGTVGEFHGGILSQEIVRGRKLQLSRAKFLHRVKTAEALALAQQFRVCNDVRVHFYKVLTQQQKVAIQQELVKSSEDTNLTAREAFNMGQANAADVRRVNVALQKSRLNLMAEQNKLRHSVRALSALVGVELEGSQFEGQLDGQSRELDFGTLLSELITNSPEMIAARCKLQSDKITVQREIVEPIPNVNLEGGVGYNFEADETVAVAGVSLKLPVFDRNQGTIQQARADLARQCAELERIQVRLKRDLAMQFEAYQTATQHINQYRQSILPELKETYRILLESYKDNRTDWNEVLQAQSDYFIARSEYLDWLSNWRQSEVLIDGMLLHGGLMTAEGPTPAGHIDAVAKPR